jgi:hypothetical protein
VQTGDAKRSAGNQPAAGHLPHDGDGALAYERDRHLLEAHAVSRDATGGVGGAADGGGEQRLVSNGVTRVEGYDFSACLSTSQIWKQVT